MKKLLGLFVAVLVSVGLTGGLVAANSGSLDTTGPDSTNEIRFENESEVDLENNTEVEAQVNTDQDAESGYADTENNTNAGDAMTGDADNMNEVEADLSIDNSGSSASALDCSCVGGDDEGTIDTTGPGSSNEIIFNNNHSVTVRNDTDVDFNSDVNQNATSGNASVSNNTNGGSASTGNASNSSSTVFRLSVTN